MADAPVHATILFSAPDRPGLVARLSGFFYELGLNILSATNFTDVHGERGPRFFMRLVVDLSGLASPSAQAKLGDSATRSTMAAAFGERIATPLEGEWSVGYSDHVARVALLVTKDPTCLYDLALRQKQGELPVRARAGRQQPRGARAGRAVVPAARSMRCPSRPTRRRTRRGASSTSSASTTSSSSCSRATCRS